MERLATLPAQHSSVSPIDSPTRNEHRAMAWDRLTSSVPEEGCPDKLDLEVRRQYRRAAGRCGGEFVVEWNGDIPVYEYVSKTPKERFVERLVALVNRSWADTSSSRTSSGESKSTTAEAGSRIERGE